MIIRYIRSWTNGNSVNGGNHWVQWQAIDTGGTNRMAGRTTTSSAGGSTAILTDGHVTTSPYFSSGEPGSQYIQMDLGAEYDITEIRLLHYWGDYRMYNGVYTQVSLDGVTWFTVQDCAKSGSYYENEGWFYINLTPSWINGIKRPYSLSTIYSNMVSATKPYSLSNARLREICNRVGTSISLTNLTVAAQKVWYRERRTVTGNNTHPATIALTKSMATHSSVTKNFTGTLNKNGAERTVHGSWVIHVAEYLKYDDTTNSSYYVGQILSTWYDGTYQYQARVTRVTSWYNGSNYTTYYDVYCVDEKRTLTKYQEYYAHMLMT